MIRNTSLDLREGQGWSYGFKIQQQEMAVEVKVVDKVTKGKRQRGKWRLEGDLVHNGKKKIC